MTESGARIRGANQGHRAVESGAGVGQIRVRFGSVSGRWPAGRQALPSEVFLLAKWRSAQTNAR